VDLMEKVAILAGAARYDVSCVSSGTRRAGTPSGIGSAAVAGICHSWSADGRCISLLKILMTNICSYDCVYCVNKASSDTRRAFLSPEELSELTISFYRRNYIEGLFLSSAVYKSPDHTTELMLRALELLRHEHRFNGYIHVKVIPGTDSALITRLGRLADRVSVNIELPSGNSLKLLAPQKTREAILKPMGFIHGRILECREPALTHSQPPFAPAGQSTQLIVGASPERDLTILRLSEGLYKTFRLRRVFFSGYVPVVAHSLLPSVITSPPLLREHRLYQADWLLRFYGFTADEILNERAPDLDDCLDPKTVWALGNMARFPVEVNKAPREELIRVPGIGIVSADRIITARRAAPVSWELLKKLGVVLKRAAYFITCKGRYYGGTSMDAEAIRSLLLPGRQGEIPGIGRQLSFLP
jgi:putative DNA modification/repair radical SAM protein